MAQFRVETVFDNKTKRYFVELYLEGVNTPLVVGNPIYLSHEHAMADTVVIFNAAMPNQPITAWTE